MPYQLEHKRTVDSTWTVDSTTLTAAQFPVTISGLNPSTQYDVRCLARDASGNISAYSAVSQTTTPAVPDTTAPTAPTITTTQTGSTSANVALTVASTDVGGSGVATYAVEYKRNADPAYIVATAAITAAQFPYALTGLLASTLYDTRARAKDVAGNVGAYSAISQASTATGSPVIDDWALRSAHPSVIWATSFENSTDVSNWHWEGGVGWDFAGVGPSANLISWRPGEGYISGSACMRLADDPVNDNQILWWRCLDPTKTQGGQNPNYQVAIGQPLHLQVRIKINANRMNNRTGSGLKLVWLATDPANGSNVGQEAIFDLSYSRRYPQLVGSTATQVSQANHWDDVQVGGSDFDQQPGSEYGLCLYSTAPAGCWVMSADVWITLHITIIGGTAGGRDTVARVEVAADGASQYVVIYDRHDLYIPYYENTPAYSAVLLANRNEDKATPIPNDCYVYYDELITSLAPIPIPKTVFVAPAWY